MSEECENSPLRYHNLLAGGPVIDQDENLYQMTSKGLFAFDSSGRTCLDPLWISLGRWLPSVAVAVDLEGSAEVTCCGTTKRLERPTTR